MNTKNSNTDKTITLTIRRTRMHVRTSVNTGKPPVRKTQDGGCGYSGSGG